LIDASTFAVQHNAFWASYTPTSEHFVRRVNLEYADRWSPPLDKPNEPIRAAFVAELAFARMCARIAGMDEHKIKDVALQETKKHLVFLLENPQTLDREITPIEEAQVATIERNLSSFFEGRKAPMVTRPLFSGCGYIDTSEGDVISETCLFEIKAVDRPFRSADLRQVMTYCALNHLSRQFDLQRVGIFNPRRGLYFEASIETVSHEISGLSGQELFDTIIHAISSGDISR
jgi:hypothetical protein